jgi:hypothetical protein
MFPRNILQLLSTDKSKNVKNSTTTKGREKIITDLESLGFQKFFHVCLTKFKNKQILLQKISHRFLLTALLFTGGNGLM